MSTLGVNTYLKEGVGWGTLTHWSGTFKVVVAEVLVSSKVQLLFIVEC